MSASTAFACETTPTVIPVVPRTFTPAPTGRPVMPGDFRPGQRLTEFAAVMRARGLALIDHRFVTYLVRVH